MSLEETVAIAGAGSIGCFVGGWLAANGRQVALLARPRVVAGIERNGLRLTSFDGAEHKVAARRLVLSDDPSVLAQAGTILVTVKSTDTASMAELIAQHAAEQATVISLQNGTGNATVLRERLSQRRVLAGMVPFNVVAKSETHFHRSTSGDIHIEQDAAQAARLSVPGLKVRASADIAALQWGKLLVNLNNALNALSNLPLRTQLARRAWRRLLAAQMTEALAVMKAAGIAPKSSTPIPPRLMPLLLQLPDGLFNALLGRTVQMDAEARSSMWDDLTRGRRTEINYLQGEIVALAERHGIEAPLSRRIVALIREAEAAGKGPPGLRPEQIGI